jgi:hypothetical protein
MAIDPGIFTLKNADDLFLKLCRDLKKLREAPTDPDVCFNFFVTAEHLPEWHLKGDAQAANKLRLGEAILCICSHIANGAKHYVATSPRHQAVVGTHVASIHSLGLGTGKTCATPSDNPREEFYIECREREAKVVG